MNNNNIILPEVCQISSSRCVRACVQEREEKTRIVFYPLVPDKTCLFDVCHPHSCSDTHYFDYAELYFNLRLTQNHATKTLVPKVFAKT